MNNKGDFFVMLTTQNGGCTPLVKTDTVTGEDEFVTFNTEAEAEKAAESSILGEMFGYEVFERGCGC